MATPSLFSTLFGGGEGDVYGDLLTEEQKRRMQQQSMLTLGAKLLQASGPSPQRVNIGQAVGGALLAGQEAYNQAGQNALTQMLTKQKIEEYKRQRELQQAIQSRLQGVSAPQAPSIDPSNVTLGATPQMSTPAMPAAQVAPADKAKALAQRYREIAMQIAPLDEAKANTYLTMADKLSPQAKPQGQPFEVKDPTDPRKNILVQGYSDGSVAPVSGYQPAGMSEADRLRFGLDLKRFGLSQAEFNRGNYEIKETSSGFAYVPKVPGMPVIPITAGGEPVKGQGAKPTEGQSAAVGFAQRMDSSEDILVRLESQGVYPGYASNLAGAVPLLGGQLQRWAQSPQEQQYFQAAQDWISAKLRKESGAAIGVEEMEKDYRTFFPMPGDSAEVIAQKQAARKIVSEGMRTAGGEFYKRPSTKGAQPAPRGKMVYKNGKWVWEQ